MATREAPSFLYLRLNLLPRNDPKAAEFAGAAKIGGTVMAEL
jgi:hypothetical protein